MIMKRCLYALAALGAVLSGTAAGEDWPEFRGPTGQGLAQGALPLEWGPAKNVAWKQPIPGSGWSSPVVVAGRVYLTSAVPAGKNGDQSLQAICLDAKTGKTVWSKEVFRQDGTTAPRIHRKNSHASPTPIVAGGRLYVHFGHQGTACLDLDGNVLWKKTVSYEPVHGNGGSPVLVDDLLVFSCDGAEGPFLIALEARTGKERWRTPRSNRAGRPFSFSTPLVITVKGKKQIVSPGSEIVAAYDPAGGKEIWRVRHGGYSVIPRPVFGHGLVFVSTSYNFPNLLAIRPDGKGDVTATHVRWRLKSGAPHTPSPLLVGDELYVVSDSGTARCLDARTGKQHWQGRVGNAFSASPLHAGGRIYFQAEDGVGVVVKAGKAFERLARNDLGERTLASYAAADGALFIRTASHLYRIRP
jgi:outer membrane protein assembly factor BamB